MVMKFTDIQCIITAIGICIDNAIRLYFIGYNRHQGSFFSILDNDRVYLAVTLEHAEYHHFSRSSSAAFAFPNATEIPFVDFNVTLKYFMCFFSKIKSYYLTNFTIKKSCRI